MTAQVKKLLIQVKPFFIFLLCSFYFIFLKSALLVLTRNLRSKKWTVPKSITAIARKVSLDMAIDFTHFTGRSLLFFTYWLTCF